MRTFLTLTMAALAAGAMLPQVAVAAERAENYEQALTKVQKNGYLVFAYAEGWDRFSKGVCDRLMASPVIAEAAGDAVMLPMPVYQFRTKEEHEKQKALMGKLGVKEAESYPAIFLFGPGHRHYATICGAVMMRADEKEIAGLIEQRIAALHKQNALLNQAEKAQGLDKARLLGEASRVEGIFRPGGVVDNIKKADPKDELGYVRSLTFNPHGFTEGLLKKKFEDATFADLKGKPREGDLKRLRELELLLKELDAKIEDDAYTPEQKQVFCANAIGFLHRKGDVTHLPLMREYAAKMEKLNPNSTLGRAGKTSVQAWAKGLTYENGWNPGTLPLDDTPVELMGDLPIDDPGTYVVTFNYKSGRFGLQTECVRLYDGDELVAEDVHYGNAALPKTTKGNIYRLKVTKPVKDPRVFIIFRVDGNRDTRGEISIRREN